MKLHFEARHRLRWHLEVGTPDVKQIFFGETVSNVFFFSGDSESI